MDRRISTSVLVLFMLMSGCGIGMRMSDLHPLSPPTPVYEPFGLVEENEGCDTGQMRLVGRLRTFDKGMTAICDYATVLDTASRLARSLGANVLKVDKHDLPSSPYGSTCHRIQARFYRSDHPEAYEKTITWWPERRLTFQDFRADTTHRPFQAASYCGLRFSGYFQGEHAHIVVEAYFDHGMSYFKHGHNEAHALAHEQLHFDIAELYARKLRQRIMSSKLSMGDLDRGLRQLQEEVMRELQAEQDRYDSEVYPDPARQAEWSTSVAARNAELAAFSDHDLSVVLAR